MLKFTNLD